MSDTHSVAALFAERVRVMPNQEAFRTPDGDGWRTLSWAETDLLAREYAAGLLSMGLGTEDRVAIMAATRLEWVLADLGVTLAGGATTAVYPTTKPDDVAYIIADSGSVIAIVEDAAQAAKLRGVREQIPAVRAMIVMDVANMPDRGEDGLWDDGWTMSLDDLAARGQAHLADDPDAVERASAALTPASLATLIYTSGTTGRPKGVELTHGNWLYLANEVDATQTVRPDQLQFLWLPLSHVFGKLLLAAQYRVGFATAIDGRIDRIVDNLAVIKPSFMAAAPRIFEKVHGRVTATAQAEGGPKAKIFSWAIGVGTQAVRLEQQGKSVPLPLSIQRALADKLVYSKVRDRLGGNIETLLSGSAALSPEVAEWFAAIGLPIMEGYGMTETTGACMVNRAGKVRIGTVGTPFNDTEVKIAEDGELLLRSPGIMRGYHNLPDQTAEVLSPDGWLSTGDVAEIDSHGYVRITDRKKDLVKTSGGKYIAPSAIEGSIKAANPMIDQVVVIADGKKFPGALIALDPDVAAELAKTKGVKTEDLGLDSEIRAGIQASIDQVNANLNKWEQIKQFRVLPRPLDVETGELTPSLKVKRAVVVKTFSDLIDDMYR